MNKKSAGLLGMARRAGKMTAGFDAVVRLLKEGKAYLVLTAADLSPKTEKELRFAAQGDKEDRIYPLEADKAALGRLLGYQKPVGVLAISDKGFAASLRAAFAQEAAASDAAPDAVKSGDEGRCDRRDDIQEGLPYDD